MSKLPHDVLGAIVSPVKTMRRLLDDPRGLRRAGLAVLAVGVMYAATSAALGVSGDVPLAPEFLNAGADNYYVWQMLFVIPYAAAAWLLSAGIIRLLGRRTKAGGTFRGAVACAGIGVAAPLFLAWLPSAAWTAFRLLGMSQEEWVGILSPPGFWQSLYLFVYTLAGVWAVVLLALGAGLSQKIGAVRAVAAGLAAAVFLAGTYALFIR